MMFVWGLLFGFITGCAFTSWNDRKNSCSKGGFHYWQEYVVLDERSGLPESGRYCSKCFGDEETLFLGRNAE